MILIWRFFETIYFNLDASWAESEAGKNICHCLGVDRTKGCVATLLCQSFKENFCSGTIVTPLLHLYANFLNNRGMFLFWARSCSERLENHCIVMAQRMVGGRGSSGHQSKCRKASKNSVNQNIFFWIKFSLSFNQF